MAIVIPPQNTPLWESSTDDVRGFPPKLLRKSWYLALVAITKSVNANPPEFTAILLPELQNGWAEAFISLYGRARYALDGKFLCHRGIIYGGAVPVIANGTSLWTSEYRPQYELDFTIGTSNAAGTTFANAQLRMETSGLVSLYGAAAGTAYIHLTSAIPLF